MRMSQFTDWVNDFEAAARRRRAEGLFVAEFIALSNNRSLRDGIEEPLAAETAERILADEERHVRFHAQQLRLEFAALPTWS